MRVSSGPVLLLWVSVALHRLVDSLDFGGFVPILFSSRAPLVEDTAFSGESAVSKHIGASNISTKKAQPRQTRAFDTTDENKTLRAIIATLQDFSFVINKADEALGTITARRYAIASNSYCSIQG